MATDTQVRLIYKPIYKRWWFWIGVLFLAAVTFYLQGYFEWKGRQMQNTAQNLVGQLYWKSLQAQSAQLEAAYRADTYGGATPEETLKLFIEALEKKDYTLASRYYIPEDKEKNLTLIIEGSKNGGVELLTNAYHSGKMSLNVGADGDLAEMEILPKAESIGYYFRFALNKFTNKWKITDQ